MAAEIQKTNYRILAAPFTPFLDNGEVNYGFVRQYTDYMLETHIEGIFVNGSLSESQSLTMKERKQLAQTWVDAAKDRMQVIVHVGCNCLKEAQELAQHAQEIGADAIAAYPPSYYKPENEEVLVDFMAELASAAPNLDFYYYEINFMTGVMVDCRKFLELSMKKIPNLKGVKHSSRQLTSAHNCVLAGEGLEILLGSDNQNLASLALGLHGVITNSYLGNLTYDLRAAFNRGDIEATRHIQGKAQKLTNIRTKHGGGYNVAKCIFKILTGLDAGPVRLPLRQLTTEQIQALQNDLEDTGLLDMAKPGY